MIELIFRDEFFKSLKQVKDKQILKEIMKKIEQLKLRVPIGKKLAGNTLWSLRVGQFRIIYTITGRKVEIIIVLKRKHSYREV